jgi:hypothetical protein
MIEATHKVIHGGGVDFSNRVAVRPKKRHKLRLIARVASKHRNAICSVREVNDGAKTFIALAVDFWQRCNGIHEMLRQGGAVDAFR